MRLSIWFEPARGPETLPLLERLETRTLLSAAPVGGAGAARHPKTSFAISDIFGAGAGIAIWQGGQPVTPGNSVGGNTASLAPLSAPVSQPASANNLLLSTAAASNASAVFSLLPVLPPDSLAAEVLGLIEIPQGRASGVFL
jgi:hypothetical protein